MRELEMTSTMVLSAMIANMQPGKAQTISPKQMDSMAQLAVEFAVKLCDRVQAAHDEHRKSYDGKTPWRTIPS